METIELKKLMYGCFRSFSLNKILNEEGLIYDLPSVIAVLVQSEIIKKQQFQEAMYYFLHCYNFGCKPKMTDEYIRITLTNGIIQRNKGVNLLRGTELLDYAFEVNYEDLLSETELPQIYSLKF